MRSILKFSTLDDSKQTVNESLIGERIDASLNIIVNNKRPSVVSSPIQLQTKHFEIPRRHIQKETTIEKQVINLQSRRHVAKKEDIKIETVIQLGKIDAIIVSVDYNDFLILTLENNIKYLENITVVTSSNDTLCKEICDKFGVKCVITDRMYEDGAKFNKGKAINDGIKSIKNPEWILLLDADIILPNKWSEIVNSNIFKKDSIHICSRNIIETHNDYQRWINGDVEVGKIESSKGFGYFQLFNVNSNAIFGKYPIFPETSDDAAWSDLSFRNKFGSRVEIPLSVVHLGKAYTNWKGRETENFIDKFTLHKMLSKIRNNGIEICKYDNIVKRNIRLISNTGFNMNKGGIYNPDIIYNNGRKYIISRCEKNYNSYTGIYENYWNSLINPMIFEIDDNYFVKSSGVFRMQNFPITVRYEDFRIFTHNGKIYSNHNITTPNYEYNGEPTWANMNISTKPGVIISVGLSEVDLDSNTISNIDVIDLGISKMEKNWSFFSKDGEIHFIYSIDPFVVYKNTNGKFIKIIEKKYAYEWNVVPDSKMKYCISTNLKRLNEEYYILFFHTKTFGYKYVQGCMILDNNLNPKYMTRNPILESDEMIGKYNSVLYVFSVDVKDSEIDVYYGEADTNCCVAILDKQSLIKNIMDSENSFKINEIYED